MKFKSLLVIFVFGFAIGSVALGKINLKAGDPASQVLETLGAPQGTAVMNGLTYYMYDGGNVIAKDGKVVSVPSNFEATAQRNQIDREARKEAEIRREQIEAEERERQAKFEVEQKAKGLVLYEKQWVTPERKTSLETKALSEKQAVLLAKQLEEIAKLREEQAQSIAKLQQQIEQKQDEINDLEQTVNDQKALLDSQANQLSRQSGALYRQARRINEIESQQQAMWEFKTSKTCTTNHLDRMRK